ncbi:MAG: hypothetical protein IPJ19_11290 [Planctomycetes bacterium]|nr:hypothetical protein [Planctomycetota bacterium]
MVLRKPNLLDAFQASAPEGKKAPPGKPPALAAGPFAHERAPHAPLPANAAAPRAQPPRRSLGSQVASDRLVQFAVVVCVVAIGITYYISRSSSGDNTSQAAGEAPAAGGTLVRETGAQPETKTAPDPAQANRKAAQLSGSEHDTSFLDKKYKFTVRVAQYPNDSAGKKSAFSDYEYLRAEGLPVVKPFANGRLLVLCVGYKASVAELKDLVEFAQKLPGKAGQKYPFHSAWVDNIDHVAARD